MYRDKTFVAVLDLLVIGMLSYVFVNLVTIQLISPENGIYTTERKPEFVWGGMQNEFRILLDDDPDFRTPITGSVTGNSYRLGEDLGFGTYYWKVESGVMSSGVRELTIGSSVILAREKDEVTNEGNTEILLHTITGAMVVGAGDSVEIGEDEDVKAEQA